MPAGARAIAVFCVFMLSLARARADAVPPAPESCPKGSTPDTGHEGPHCAPAVCKDGKCEAGERCEAMQLCVDTVVGAHRGGTSRTSDVKGPCVAGKCAVGTCQSLSVCVKKDGPLSRCGCRAGSAEAPPWALMILLVASTGLRRRQRERRAVTGAGSLRG